MANHFRKQTLIVFLLPALFISDVRCEELDLPEIKTDRYTLVKLAPSVSLVEPLKTVVQIKFPGAVVTVGDAINYMLDESGYRVVDKGARTVEMEIMLSNALPAVQRDLTKSPMTIKSVLEVLAGPAFRVVQDPLRRLVTFELKNEYRGLIDG